MAQSLVESSSWPLSVTDLANWVSQQQCSRYLRLVNLSCDAALHELQGQELLASCGLTPSEVRGRSVDPAFQESGAQLEQEVFSGLRALFPAAPYLSVRPGATHGTPWTSFLALLQDAASPADAARDATTPPISVGCWAAEVELRCKPVAGSPVELSARADFLILLWREGRPVLRVVECKASSSMRTEYKVQVVAYRAMVRQLLREAGHVEVGGRRWDAEEVAVECALCVRGIGRQRRQQAAEGRGGLDALTGVLLCDDEVSITVTRARGLFSTGALSHSTARGLGSATLWLVGAEDIQEAVLLTAPLLYNREG